MDSDKELDITIYEDIRHLTNLLNTPDTKNADIRNSVHILRRLLIHNDLQKSANSRKFELVIDAPDVKPFVKATRYGLLEFYQAGGANVLGVYVSGSMVAKGQSHRLNRIMRDHHPENSVPLKIGSFLRQQCFSLKGEFVTREDVIKYVANKAGNAHFDRKGRDTVIDKIRGSCEIRLTEEGYPSFGFNFDAFENDDFSFNPDPRNIDPVFIEVAATAKYLVESERIKEYCKLLEAEHA
ncbi:hypothetical protein [Pseudidiomarina sp. YC-516-91]|uniref:hypothetical protein n=1 Tax=Pseudidiomarina salilacus TaxID=3384452 RepID=UPI00398532CD